MISALYPVLSLLLHTHNNFPSRTPLPYLFTVWGLETGNSLYCNSTFIKKTHYSVRVFKSASTSHNSTFIPKILLRFYSKKRLLGPPQRREVVTDNYLVVNYKKLLTTNRQLKKQCPKQVIDNKLKSKVVDRKAISFLRRKNTFLTKMRKVLLSATQLIPTFCEVNAITLSQQLLHIAVNVCLYIKKIVDN